MTPAEIVDRLGGRLQFLRTITRAETARHRTLQTVIDWSYDLLDERQRQVFCRLSVFAGPFTLDAAASVAGQGSDVAGVVADLVDRSMVVAHTGQVRVFSHFRGCHQTRSAVGGATAANQPNPVLARLSHRPAARAALSGPAQATWHPSRHE